jgi:hypothetical protein
MQWSEMATSEMVMVAAAYMVLPVTTDMALNLNCCIVNYMRIWVLRRYLMAPSS